MVAFALVGGLPSWGTSPLEAPNDSDSQAPHRRCKVPGTFTGEMRIWQCGTHSDGTAIYCSEIKETKIPFMLARENVGWQEAGSTDVHIPLENLITALEKYGVEVAYDEAELLRKVGSPPDSSTSSAY